MSRRPRGFKAAALINCDVYDHGSGLHAVDMVSGDELGRGGAGYEHGPYDKIRLQSKTLDGILG